MCTCREHQHIFGPDEWMWADSAYPSETWSVSPFKKPAKRELSPDQKTLSMPLDCSKADFSHCLSSKSKSTHTKSISGLSCGFDAVSSSIILYCKLKLGKMIGSGERNSTISGINGRELNTDAGRRKLRWKVRMTQMSSKLLVVVS